MTVKELIRRLKKMDPEAPVVFQDHDHGPDEINGEVDSVEKSDSPVLSTFYGRPPVCLR